MPLGVLEQSGKVISHCLIIQWRFVHVFSLLGREKMYV